NAARHKLTTARASLTTDGLLLLMKVNAVRHNLLLPIQVNASSKPNINGFSKVYDIDADKDITLDSTHFDTDPDMFGVQDLDGDEVFVETERFSAWSSPEYNFFPHRKQQTSYYL
ncbi:hypothetical protein Tco_0503241, partial [Tanacetum coccineum]